MDNCWIVNIALFLWMMGLQVPSHTCFQGLSSQNKDI